jgi:glycosyltransferase involved in cell wall biosynthesis
MRWGGPLVQDARATGSRVVFEPLRRTRAALRLWAPSRRLATWLEQIAAGLVVAAVRPDVVWCNTALSACYVRPARLLGRQVILHAHEAAAYLNQSLGRYRLGAYWDAVTLVGCAASVCSDLAAATHRPPSDVICLHSVADPERVVALSRLGKPDLPPHGLVVGACGTADERKGVDLWLQMIDLLWPQVADLDPLFLWIGGTAPDGFADWAERSPFASRVRFVGRLENPYPWLAALDVFVLPSRTDPFPLVVLEAMLLGKPVVAFSVGDVAEQLGDTGVLVPPLAFGSLAAAVAALARDRVERERLGNEARRRAQVVFSTEGFRCGVNRVPSVRAAHLTRP